MSDRRHAVDQGPNVGRSVLLRFVVALPFALIAAEAGMFSVPAVEQAFAPPSPYGGGMPSIAQLVETARAMVMIVALAGALLLPFWRFVYFLLRRWPVAWWRAALLGCFAGPFAFAASIWVLSSLLYHGGDDEEGGPLGFVDLLRRDRLEYFVVNGAPAGAAGAAVLWAIVWPARLRQRVALKGNVDAGPAAVA